MEFVPYIVSGLVAGSVYGLAGTGLVLTYKTSAVFNFAHGALATLSAFVFYTLFVTHGVPWAAAVAICLLVIAPAVGVGLELVARRLTGTGLAVRVASTVGLLLVIQAVIVLVYGSTNQKTFPHFLPRGGFHIGSTPVTVEVRATSAARSATNPGIVMSALLFSYNPLSGGIGEASTMTAEFTNASQAGITYPTS